MMEMVNFEVEYHDKKYNCELKQVRGTLVSGHFISAIGDIDKNDIDELFNLCKEGERFFLGLELLAYKMGLQKESERSRNKNYDTDYDLRFNPDLSTKRSIAFNISYRNERKDLSVGTVRNMIENVTSYLRIKDMIGILRSIEK